MDLDLCGDDSFFVTWDFEFGGITVVDEAVKRPTYRPAFRLFRALATTLAAYGLIVSLMRRVGILSTGHCMLIASGVLAVVAAGLVAMYHLHSRPIVRQGDRASRHPSSPAATEDRPQKDEYRDYYEDDPEHREERRRTYARNHGHPEDSEQNRP